MVIVEIVQYEHFISFTVQAEGGDRFNIQYRADQVKQDADGVWYIGDDQQPFSVIRLPALQHDAPKLSSTIVDAIERALESI